MIMLKSLVRALIILLLILVCSSYAEQSNGNSTNFSFAYFSRNNSRQLIYMGNASFSPADGHIDLTPDPYGTMNISSNETATTMALQNCIGRVLYRQQLTMWPASFTTVFTIFVKNITTNGTGTQKNYNGDGIAFVIVPNNKSFLAKSYGGFLGLFDPSTNGNSTRQLGIEFDTFQNEFDPDNNHVGIDIQGIKSNVTANMENHGMDIKAGRAIQVRVDYDGWAKSLQIYARYANNTSGYASILNHTLELENTVPRSAYVGFSAATGNSYEIHRILDWNFSSVMLPESSLNFPPVGTGTPGGLRRWVKIGILMGSIAVGLVVVGLVGFVVWRMRKKKQPTLTLGRGSFSGELAIMQNAPHRYSYKQLVAATDNFSEAELLGTGGFGSVYRGNLNAGRNEQVNLVAVKKVSAGSRQGEREFISEIISIGRLRHRHLVKLHGWCHERDELLLVYEYMPNGSLDKFLYDRTGETTLNWPRRHRILCGLASALLYLHEEWEQRVVHRDVKPSNVMLDGEFNARLGDFGLARLVEHDDSNPAVTTRLAGTPGYMAPECSYTGKATAESDVFSFGIVLLEVATGRRVVERGIVLAERNLAEWVWGLYSQDRLLQCVDPKLEGSDYDEEQIRRVLILGLACSHPDPQLRPTVRQAIQVLINPSEELPQLPSTRPMAIYVVLPPAGAGFSLSTSSSIMGGGAASSSLMAETSVGSITTSITKGR
ncbi:L-type lectin-domain containing receptor kinase IX.1-like [Cryptomeria japonica]|uniref:L-type lectin-domain containing receptor kinase IX.1-like n=1 Tax=Cryptomeria japonica TaxID=3369 RepID=UPI0027DA33A9|nr:L-type lectin-domain containing receptor kinase IX.1-like [Cryptomeria japonica]